MPWALLRAVFVELELTRSSSISDYDQLEEGFAHTLLKSQIHNKSSLIDVGSQFLAHPQEFSRSKMLCLKHSLTSHKPQITTTQGTMEIVLTPSLLLVRDKGYYIP